MGKNNHVFIDVPLDPLEARSLYRKGLLPGVIRRERVEELQLSDVIRPVRPFFKKMNHEDEKYVTTIRLILFSGIRRFGCAEESFTYQFHAGKVLGQEMVTRGIIKSLDDLFPIFINYKIGIVDIVKESGNNMVIDVYECITCSGLPILGRPVCYFETGVLSAILSHLIGDNTVREVECWGLGNTRCRFIVKFK